MPHTNVLQTAMTAFSVTKYLRHSEQKRTSEQCHVTNDAKLFGIDDFSVAKDFGKVFIIIIYCFYNYYYYY